jgi:hypothetical protein
MSPVEEDGLREEAGRGTPRLPIAELDLSLVKRVRAETSAEAIEDYAAQLKHLPPIRVAMVDGRRVVVGGLHRVRAYERADSLEIPCIIEPMTWAEAVRAGVADNHAQGVRMTRADKRAAITLLLAEVADLSDRAVAKLVGCSPSTVGEVRTLSAAPPEEEQVSKLDTSAAPGARVRGPNRRATTRKGSDGKLYRRPGKPHPDPSSNMASQRPAVQEEYPHSTAPQMAPALLIDFRAKAAWVASFLRCVLRTEGGGHRTEALDEVLAALTSDELRRLSRQAGEVAEVRAGRPMKLEFVHPTAH